MQTKLKTQHSFKGSVLVTLLVVSFAIAAMASFISTSNAAPDSGWTLVNDARAMKAYPDLREYVWQKNANMAPHGQYDIIGLHRLVKPGVASKGVIFLVPQYFGSGEQMISNPPSSNYTRTENNTQAIYWANRGYDVYAIDYRTHFVPINLNRSDLGFMADWGWDQWISDIKEAVNKAKDVSGTGKVFMAGFLQGGFIAMYYASEYWQQDLRGIIILDTPAITIVKNQNAPNTFDLNASLSIVKSGNWSLECANTSPSSTMYTPGSLIAWQYAAQNPTGPAVWPPGTPLQGTPRQPPINPLTNKTWANITEYMNWQFNSTAFSPFINVIGGYGNGSDFLQWIAAMDRYLPSRLYYEMNAIADWTNCPGVTYDFDETFKNINVPILCFRSGLMANSYGSYIYGYATSDFTTTLLPKYGTFDVPLGTYSARDVSQPVLDWMLNRYQPPSASAFCSVTVMTGQTWYFFANSAGSNGPITYQWYEGTTILTGQNSMVLPMTKTTAGTYTYYCRVTDSEGTSANSNTITLSVINR